MTHRMGLSCRTAVSFKQAPAPGLQDVGTPLGECWAGLRVELGRTCSLSCLLHDGGMCVRFIVSFVSFSRVPCFGSEFLVQVVTES